MALTLTGRVYAWGSGQNGQLGLGSVRNSNEPAFIDFLKDEKVIDIICGDSNALALTQSGKVYGWGQGISKSQTLIKSLRDSSASQQSIFQTHGDFQSLSQNSPSMS